MIEKVIDKKVLDKSVWHKCCGDKSHCKRAIEKRCFKTKYKPKKHTLKTQQTPLFFFCVEGGVLSVVVVVLCVFCLSGFLFLFWWLSSSFSFVFVCIVFESFVVIFQSFCDSHFSFWKEFWKVHLEMDLESAFEMDLESAFGKWWKWFWEVIWENEFGMWFGKVTLKSDSNKGLQKWLQNVIEKCDCKKNWSPNVNATSDSNNRCAKILYTNTTKKEKQTQPQKQRTNTQKHTHQIQTQKKTQAKHKNKNRTSASKQCCKNVLQKHTRTVKTKNNNHKQKNKNTCFCVFVCV